MRTLKMFIVIFAVMTLLAACGQKPEKSEKKAGEKTPDELAAAVGYVGYVVKKSGDGILVVNSTEHDYSSGGGASHYYEAIWFTKAPDEVVIGDRVDVLADGVIAESYPAQGAAASVRVLPSTESAGAKRKESEAVRIALKDSRVAGYEIPVVKTVSYDEVAKAWIIEVTRSGDGNPIRIQVTDLDDRQELGDMPPMPIVTAGDQAIAVEQSSYCWTTKKSGDTSESVCADYVGPSDMLKDKPKDQVTAGQKIEFRFDSKQPTEISVARFEDGAVIQETLDGNRAFVAPSKPGEYYYSLSANWLRDVDKRISEGSSSYAFAIEVK